MANIKSHRGEWLRMLQLLDQEVLTEAESQELKNLKAIFQRQDSKPPKINAKPKPNIHEPKSVKPRPTKMLQNNRRRRTALILIDPDGNEVAETESITDMCVLIGASYSVIKYALFNKTPINKTTKDKYKGYTVDYANPQFEEVEESHLICTGCFHYKHRSEFRVFSDGQIGKYCLTCREKAAQKRAKRVTFNAT